MMYKSPFTNSSYSNEKQQQQQQSNEQIKKSNQHNHDNNNSIGFSSGNSLVQKSKSYSPNQFNSGNNNQSLGYNSIRSSNSFGGALSNYSTPTPTNNNQSINNNHNIINSNYNTNNNNNQSISKKTSLTNGYYNNDSIRSNTSINSVDSNNNNCSKRYSKQFQLTKQLFIEQYCQDTSTTTTSSSSSSPLTTKNLQQHQLSYQQQTTATASTTATTNKSNRNSTQFVLPQQFLTKEEQELLEELQYYEYNNFYDHYTDIDGAEEYYGELEEDDEEDGYREEVDQEDEEDMDAIEVPKVAKKDVALINANAEEGSVHTFSEEEKVAYSKFISERLGDQQTTLSAYIPIDPSSNMLFTACNDGVLLNKLMESLFPNQVDLKGLVIKLKMNPFEQIGNQNIVIKNATKVGCIIVNIGAQDLVNATPYLVLGIIWQIIKAGLLAMVNQNANDEILDILFEEQEEDQQIKEGEDHKTKEKEEHSAEQILLRWVNYHLEKAGCERRITNFSEDVQDSIIYANLFAQLVPIEFSTLVERAQNESNLFVRAEFITNACDKLGVKCFLTPSDIALGHPKLNLALVASLFNSEAAIADMRQTLELERADRERLERERVERDRAERERKEQERAERERLEKERLEREAIERERVERERLEREREDMERAEREKVERERLEKERMERELAERERMEREREERERMEKEIAERERMEREKSDREANEQERLENLKEYRIATRIQKTLAESPSTFENMGKLVGDITELKRNLVGEIRNTRNLQTELRRLTKSIDRVLENKKEGKKLKKLKKKIKPVKGVANGLNPIKMRNYQSLFYYIQNQPHVMGKILYLLSSSQISKTSQSLLLSLYPYEVSPREEDLFLKSLSFALEYQISSSGSLTEFMASESVPLNLLFDYFRKKGLKYLQEVITPGILRILNQPDLDLNFDPVWIHKQLQRDKELKEGKKSDRSAKTFDQCLGDPQVASLHQSRISQLLEFGADFLDRIVKSLDQIPVQLRFLCREISEKAVCSFAKKSGEHDHQVTYYFLIYRFITSIIASPDLLNELVLLSHPLIAQQARMNLSLVSRLLQSAFSNRAWLHPYATPKIAAWIESQKDVANKFLESVTNVPDLDELIHYTEYNQVMAENNISFCTVVNVSEVIWLHETILDFYYDLVDVGTLSYDPKTLNEIAKKNYSMSEKRRYQIGSPKQHVSGRTDAWWLQSLLDQLESPILLPEQGDRSIQLTFINNHENETVMPPDLFKEAKIWMIEILSKTPPPKKDVNSIRILLDAIQFCKTGNNTAENMTLIAKCDQLIERLKSFRQELVSSEPEVYDIFLLEVEKELQSVLRKNKLMRSELDRLYNLLKKVRIETTPLENLVKFQNEQLSKAIAKKELRKQQSNTDSKEKPIKQILSDLVKKGMVLHCDLPESSHSKTNVYIKQLGGGIFEIEAKFGLISKTVTLELDQLLEYSKNHIEEYPLEGITLHVNMTIHMLMKLFNLS
ncbi:calponin domain-containing protein [Heterostelium album PN500]|uniref:Calponin domain-containing protein n=1 Tax=Heterostelium pallidum (strain ATCC 26659 / Pp 5 / PN500) TaxID=670386 RepID=D3BE17_HETP5|nr:calponin domain-containing protein [Heterostelium album PN500]EFA80148.1 calponin domain-containing protein [Heterostelium album PN500]|eukprot:XP_020432268.1 calponin domain-containing protein [Heterostelium album PN500]